MDDFVDTADFDLTYMMNLWYGYRDLLPADVRAAMEQHMRSFKYWFTDPQPAGTIDQRYYWSENHRLLFHADEYLAGQAFPNDVFGSDGNTGAWHKAARPRLHRRLADREGALRLHRVALGRLLPEDGGRAAHDHRVGRRPRARAARVVDPRPALLRHRAQHPARQLRCDARPVLHEGQERRHRSRHVQHVEAAVRRHLAAVHVPRRRRAPRCSRGRSATGCPR